MILEFPEDFFWGTSTSAAQIETAEGHQWEGLEAKDGFIFKRTIDHEKQRLEDAKYITQFGSVYRCSVDWSRLQKGPFAPFEQSVVEEYQNFFAYLNDEGIKVMLVLYHFAHPIWFEKKGGWIEEENISIFVNFAEQCYEHFGVYVFNWNTFNEPNVYALNAFLTGYFPPHQKRKYRSANRVLKHMAMAHEIIYEIFKENKPEIPIGISLNTAWFKGINFLGIPGAVVSDWWFNRRPGRLFKNLDYWGISYYAYVPFTPIPLTEITHPGKLEQRKIPHDKMWGYYPEGLGKIIHRLHKKYKKAIIITESGICTDDPNKRIESIKDYLKVIHQAIQNGIDIKGYIHWSTFDNFEWNLGPTYRFGLVRVNAYTKERTLTEAGVFYAKIAQENKLELEEKLSPNDTP